MLEAGTGLNGGGIDGEQVLLDSNAEAEDHDFFSLGGFSLSDDDNLLAWSVDVVGDERYTIRVKDLRTGRATARHRGGHERRRHLVGGRDALLLHDRRRRLAPVPRLAARARQHRRRRRSCTRRPTSGSSPASGAPSPSATSSSARRRRSPARCGCSRPTTPTGEFRVVRPRETGVEYSLEHARLAGEDVFLMLHNRDALNFELVGVPAAGPYDDGTVLIGHRDDVRLEDVDVFAKQLVVSYRRDAIARIAVILLDDDAPNGLAEPREIDFGQELFTSGVGANAEWDQPLDPGGIRLVRHTGHRLRLRRRHRRADPAQAGSRARRLRPRRLRAAPQLGHRRRRHRRSRSRSSAGPARSATARPRP